LPVQRARIKANRGGGRLLFERPRRGSVHQGKTGSMGSEDRRGGALLRRYNMRVAGRPLSRGSS